MTQKRNHYYTHDEILTARSIPLVDYLNEHESEKIVSMGENKLVHQEFGSITFNGEKWYCADRKIGGVCALDFLTRVRSESLAKALDVLMAGSKLNKEAASPLIEENIPYDVSDQISDIVEKETSDEKNVDPFFTRLFTR